MNPISLAAGDGKIEKGHIVNDPQNISDQIEQRTAAFRTIRDESVPIINCDVALTRMGGDMSLLLDLARFYLVDAPTLLTEAEAALANRDALTLQRAAHSLKGLSANFDSLPASRAASKVVQLGHDGDWEQAKTSLKDLHNEVGLVIQSLNELLEREGK